MAHATHSTATATSTEDNYLNHEKGIWSWLTTVDHKRIAVMYLISILTFFLVGGIFALLLRGALFNSGENKFWSYITPEVYNQFMSYHGIIMVFMVIVPGIPAVFGNFLLPVMLGAKDVAFPRLNLASYYVYLLGAAIAGSTLFLGKIDTGWTFYTPYSIKTSTSVIMAV